MIDWTDFVINVVHTPIPAGRIVSIGVGGDVEWDTPKAMQVSGSYESSIRVRSQGGDGSGLATELYISGNPSKFLQGHNVFGSDDLLSLCHAVASRVFIVMGIQDDLALRRVALGDFQVKRIDLTYSYDFGNSATVSAVLSSLAVRTRSRMGRAQTRGGTVYHGRNSRRWSIKMYNKGEELQAGKKHRLSPELQSTPIFDFSQSLLRVELTLRSKQLKELSLDSGRSLTPATCRQLFDEYFGRVEMSPQVDIASDEVISLPRAIRSTYLLWKEGIDVRNMHSRPTFYRHRSHLLRYGVDIDLPVHSDESNVIPMFRTVVGNPVSIPSWAYDDNLVFDPRRIGG